MCRPADAFADQALRQVTVARTPPERTTPVTTTTPAIRMQHAKAAPGDARVVRSRDSASARAEDRDAPESGHAKRRLASRTCCPVDRMAAPRRGLLASQRRRSACKVNGASGRSPVANAARSMPAAMRLALRALRISLETKAIPLVMEIDDAVRASRVHGRDRQRLGRAC
jgi:hypothetical protein